MAMDFSIYNTLVKISNSVPNWIALLDEINDQSPKRQLELARFTEKDRLPTRLLRNKDSFSGNPSNADDAQTDPFDSSNLLENSSATSAPQPSSSTTSRKLGMFSILPLGSPPPQSRVVPDSIRKRKFEWLASGELKAPKHKSRSMVIVCYDSTVQTKLEDLVRSMSASQRDIRNGRVAAKMAETQRAAELEGSTDEDSDDVDGGVDGLQKSSPGNAMAADSDSGDTDTPSLELKIKPLRDLAQKADALRYRKAGIDTTPGFFDGLGKALEGCQGQCERAATQVLRDGDVSTEIHKIKQTLEEVKKLAEQEMERIRQVEAANPTLSNWRSDAGSGSRSLVLEVPLTREFGLEAMKNLEVDHDAVATNSSQK